MQKSDDIDSKKKLEVLQENFRELMPSTISDIESLMKSLEGKYTEETFKNLHEILLRLNVNPKKSNPCAKWTILVFLPPSG